MKKLSKIKLRNAVVLENKEMKKIFGGSGTPLCPDDQPYVFRCPDGSLRCCKVNDEVKCCADNSSGAI